MTGDNGHEAERIIIGPAERCPAIVGVIDAARERLALSIFRCDHDAVIEALERAVRRGVRRAAGNRVRGAGAFDGGVVKSIVWVSLALALCASSAAAQTEQQREEPPPVRLTFPGRPSLRIGSVFRLDVRLRVQGDVRGFSPEDVSDESGFEVTRRRLGLQGTAFEYFDYEIEKELKKDGLWRDTFVNFDYFDDYQVQAGKFKLPFSLERLTGSTDLDFIYRSRAVDELAPARDIGATVHGRFNNRAVGYDAGVFRHDGEAARSDVNPGGGTTFAGRGAARPMRLTSATGGTREMEVGAAVTVSEVPEGLNSLKGETTFGLPFFEPVYVKGRRLRLGFDADWRPGPFSVKAEFIRVADERKNQGILEEDLPDLVSRGWYLSGTWVVTGERKLGDVDPRAPLLRGGFGAIELAARVERLVFGSSLEGEPELTNPRAANLLETTLKAFTFGVNWYVNRWVKIQLNAVRESMVEVDARADADPMVVWSRVLRLQFVM